jgi:ABC-type glycerol-3-phosphate transport system substrate-binding protein
MRTNDKAVVTRLTCALVCVAVLFVVGCGGGDDSSDQEANNSDVNASNWTLAKAAEPYKGTEIRVLDEVTDLQPAMKTLVPEFEKETGIKVSYELEAHPDVIRKGEADAISGRGAYDAIMVHVQQAGRVLAADAIEYLDEFYDNEALHDPEVTWDSFIQPLTDEATMFDGKRMAFPNWNYNNVWWGRRDLMENAEEKAAFEERYGRELAPPKTLQELRDFAEFFTRKKGEKLAGETLTSDFAGFNMEGSQAGSAVEVVDRVFMEQFGGGVFDDEGKPAANRPENAEAMALYGELWKYAPAGQAEMSLIDVPVVMAEGRAASGLIWSDFTFAIDKEGGSQYAGDFIYAPTPTNADNPDVHSTAVQPGMLMISKASENKEATYLFLQWLVSKETQDKWFDTGVGMPVREDAWENPKLTEGDRKQFYEAVKETMANGSPWKKGPKLYEAFDAVNRMQQAVGQGKATPEAALETLQGDLEEICEDSCYLSGN